MNVDRLYSSNEIKYLINNNNTHVNQYKYIFVIDYPFATIYSNIGKLIGTYHDKIIFFYKKYNKYYKFNIDDIPKFKIINKNKNLLIFTKHVPKKYKNKTQKYKAI
jgi:hypothetical protein